MDDLTDSNVSIADMLPENYICLGFVAVVKCLDADGELAIVNLRADGIPKWEAVGMHMQATDDLRDQLRAYVERGDE